MSKPKNEVVTYNEKDRETLINKFVNVNTLVFNNAKRDSWKLASTALSVVTDKRFKKAFKNQGDFAKAVGYTDGAMSKLVSCAEMDKLHSLNESYNLTTGQAQELIPLYRIETQILKEDENADVNIMQDFLKAHDEDFINMTTKDVRKAVQEELLLLSGSEPKEDVEDAEDVVDAEELAPSETESVQDDVPKNAEEVLNEIIGIMRQAEELDVMDESGGWNYSIMIPAFSAIRTLLQGEELL